MLRRTLPVAALTALVVSVPSAHGQGPAGRLDPVLAPAGPALAATPPVVRGRSAVTRLTIAASGDLLIHSPLWQRAAANAGGRGYDFAPLFKLIRPYVAGSTSPSATSRRR